MRSVAEEITHILSPILGKGLATSTVYMQCRKIGILPEDLSVENIEEFSIHFKKIMQIFAGEQIAEDIAVQIRKIKTPNGAPLGVSMGMGTLEE